MKTIALYSIKGGVGKTAAAVNLSYLASRDSQQTLVCDLDPCARAPTTRIAAREKIQQQQVPSGAAKKYTGTSRRPTTKTSICCHRIFHTAISILSSSRRKTRRKLRKNLEELSDEYRYIFFDCPPNLTLFSESILAAVPDLILKAGHTHHPFHANL